MNGDEVGDIHFSGHLIVSEPHDDEVIDASGMTVAPGLIDIQINGGFGLDFTQDPNTIWDVGQRLPELGVTSFVPTVVTSPDQVTDLAIDVVAHRKPADYVGAEVLGLHFEGPWIAPEMVGAHNYDHIVDPNPEVARKWVESGVVRIVTLAPELPQATQVGDLLARNGIVVSIGHTNANSPTARTALSTYSSLATHLFNQMNPLSHREPGVVGAVLASPHHAILIVDGHHLADLTVQLAWRLLGPHRTVLATDAMAALGLGPGTYQLGDGPITVGDDGPRTSNGRLAGSATPLSEAILRLHQTADCEIPEALGTATLNPANVLGLGDRGSLRAGKRADMVLLDAELRPLQTIIGGNTAVIA